jgi:hypothetical protein
MTVAIALILLSTPVAASDCTTHMHALPCRPADVNRWLDNARVRAGCAALDCRRRCGPSGNYEGAGRALFSRAVVERMQLDVAV